VLVTNDVDEALLLADRVVPLGLGPRASLGPAFPVTLARPRRRAALNHDPGFVKLRNEITAHLLALRAARQTGRHASAIPPLPPLEPRR
jgi:nitrate/nitrite transport system ATP-binding protein